MKGRFYIPALLYITILLILIANNLVISRQASYQWGNISIKVSPKTKDEVARVKNSNTLPPNLQIKDIEINIPKIKINFFSYVNISRDGTSSYLHSISPLPSGEGFMLQFDNDTYISFQTNVLNPDAIAMIVHSKPNRTLYIPMFASMGTKTKLNNNFLEITNLQDKIIASPSRSSSFVKAKRRNAWQFITNRAYASLRFYKEQEMNVPLITDIPRIAATVRYDTQNSIKAYLDKAFYGWGTKRFDTSRGAWLHPEGFKSFSEATLVAVYSEAIKQGKLAQLKLLLDKSAAINREYLTWRSAFASPESPSIFYTFFEEVKKNHDYVLSEINSGNRSVLWDQDVWQSIPFWDDTKSIDTLVDFIKQEEAVHINPEISSMILYQSLWLDLPKFTEYIEENANELEENIINNIAVVNNGYMLVDSTKQINIVATLYAGKFLASAASVPEIQNLGYRMIYTTLSLSSEEGYLPRRLLFSAENILPLGYITPEEIYSILSEDAYSPVIQASNIPTLYRFAASDMEFQAQKDGLSINIRSRIKDSTQWLFVWPIETPRSILAFDLEWTGAPFPEEISKGVMFNKAFKLLIIKTPSRSTTELIQVYF